MEFWDNYDHIDPKIIYMPESSGEMCDNDLSGCTCFSECKTDTCICLSRSGAIYTFEDTLDIDSYRISIINQQKPTYECNAHCQCSKVCGNKLVQYGPQKNLKIINTEEVSGLNNESSNYLLKGINKKGKGHGLVSLIPINKGNFVCEYAGEIISRCEAKKRYQTYKSSGMMNYILCINEYFGDNRIQTFIDPTSMGNIGRYINHSCEPNCELVPVRISSITPKLYIFAVANIEKEEEITFDYGNQSNLETANSITNDRILCLCKSNKCRKYLPFDPTLS